MAAKYYEAYDLRYRQIHQQHLQWASERPSPIVGEVLKGYPVPEGARLLEIGCGEGRDAVDLLCKGLDVLATDISPEAVAFCQNKAPAFAEHFRVLDCIAGMLEETFDFIYAVAVLHMLVLEEDRRAFYRFIRDHLKPRGLALICTMGDGKTEIQSDIQTAFEPQERVHQGTGKTVWIAGTSCRMVGLDAFQDELSRSNLAVLEMGLTAAPPDFPQMLYAVVRKADSAQ